MGRRPEDAGIEYPLGGYPFLPAMAPLQLLRAAPGVAPELIGLPSAQTARINLIGAAEARMRTARGSTVPGSPEARARQAIANERRGADARAGRWVGEEPTVEFPSDGERLALQRQQAARDTASTPARAKQLDAAVEEQLAFENSPAQRIARAARTLIPEAITMAAAAGVGGALYLNRNTIRRQMLEILAARRLQKEAVALPGQAVLAEE